MNYQVWIKDEYGDTYTKVECGDLGAAKRELDKAVRAGQEPLLTIEVPYELMLKVGEPGSEVTPRQPKPSKDTRPESPGKDRPGDTKPVSE